MKLRDVTIHRQFKHEAEQAISDLERRGFEIVYPLTELKKDGKRFKSDTFNRKIFIENTFSSCWIAKMRKVKEHESRC